MTEGAKTQRRRKNATQACQGCRDQHIGCKVSPVASNVPPTDRTCMNCAKAGIECVWSEDLDKRRTVPKHEYEITKGEIKRLQKKEKALRRILRENSIRDDLPIDDEEDAGYASEDEVNAQFDQLALNGSGILYHGTSSMFAGGPPPPRNISRLAAREGIQHSTSRIPGTLRTHRLRLSASAFPIPADSTEGSHWDMYLPRGGFGEALITRPEHDTVLDRFFRFLCPRSLLLIPLFFLRDLTIATESPHLKPPTNHYSPMLHNVVVAMALGYADTEALRDRELRNKFIGKAKDYMDKEMQRPAFSGVQSLAILAAYCNSLGSPNLGYTYFGGAVYIAKCLGLHVTIPDKKMENDERIERNWIWWSLFVQDKTWSLYLGRGQAINESEMTILPPQVDHRMNEDIWEWTSADRTSTKQPSHLSSAFFELTKLMRITSKIQSLVYYPRKRPGGSLLWGTTDINSVFRELYDWNNSLDPMLYINEPAEARCPPHVIELNLTYDWNVLLLLNEFFRPDFTSGNLASLFTPQPSEFSRHPPNIPFGRRADGVRRLIEMAKVECQKSASRILDLVKTYDRLYSLRFSPMLMNQMTFAAGQILMKTVTAGSRSDGGTDANLKLVRNGQRFREKVKECIGYLRAIGETWPSGVVAADKLHTALQDIIDAEKKAEMAKNLGARVRKRAAPSPPLQPVRLREPPKRSLQVENLGASTSAMFSEFQIPGSIYPSFIGAQESPTLSTWGTSHSVSPVASSSSRLMPHSSPLHTGHQTRAILQDTGFESSEEYDSTRGLSMSPVVSMSGISPLRPQNPLAAELDLSYHGPFPFPSDQIPTQGHTWDHEPSNLVIYDPLYGAVSYSRPPRRRSPRLNATQYIPEPYFDQPIAGPSSGHPVPRRWSPRSAGMALGNGSSPYVPTSMGRWQQSGEMFSGAPVINLPYMDFFNTDAAKAARAAAVGSSVSQSPSNVGAMSSVQGVPAVPGAAWADVSEMATGIGGFNDTESWDKMKE